MCRWESWEREIKLSHEKEELWLYSLFTGLSRREYWSGVPFPSPGDLFGLGVEPVPPMSPVLAGGFFTIEPPGKPWCLSTIPY